MIVFSSLFMKAQTTNLAPYCSTQYDFQYNMIDQIIINATSYLFGPMGNSSSQDPTLYYNNVVFPNLTLGNNANFIFSFHSVNDIEPIYFAVWIDYNHNNIFESSERVIENSNTTNAALPTMGAISTPITTNITVPLTATLGATRMRIMRGDDPINPGSPYDPNVVLDPCIFPNVNYGMVADFNINLIPPPPVLVTSITVTGQGGVSTITLNAGTLQMLASILPTNATNSTVTWSVANGTGSATINPTTGLLTALTNGTVTVTATANDISGVTGTKVITITNQIVYANSMLVQGQGGVNTITVNAGTLQMVSTILPTTTTNQSVTWSVQNGTGSATIDPVTGILTAITNGTVIVKATANDGSGIFDTEVINISNQIVYVNSITVQGQGGINTITVNAATLQMQATVLPANATNGTYTWSVVNGTGTATIDPVTGILTPITNGTVTVIATANDGTGITGSVVVTISNQIFNYITSIVVYGQGNVSTITTNAGTLQMLATILPTNATNNSISWSVQNGTGSATINQTTGLLTAVSNGMVTVRASALDGSNVYGTKVITISNQGSNLPVTMITVVSNSNTVNEGNNLQMFATVLPNAASNNSVTWSLVNGTGTASISTSGILSGITAGTVEVKATANDGTGIFGTKTITVTKPNSVSNLNDALISIYPNPIKDIIFIKNNTKKDIVSFEIYSIIGEKIIASTKLNTNTININHLNNGQYILVLRNASNEIITKRISKN